MSIGVAVILGVMAALELIILVFIIALMVRMEDKFGIFDTISKSQGQIYKESLKETFDLYKALSQREDTQNELINKVCEAFTELNRGYQVLADQHKKLLECWKGIDERYSVTCEQFEEISKGMSDTYAKTDEIMGWLRAIEDEAAHENKPISDFQEWSE